MNIKRPCVLAQQCAVDNRACSAQLNNTMSCLYDIANEFVNLLSFASQLTTVLDIVAKQSLYLRVEDFIPGIPRLCSQRDCFAISVAAARNIRRGLQVSHFGKKKLNCSSLYNYG